jgi:hypothetical protein
MLVSVEPATAFLITNLEVDTVPDTVTPPSTVNNVPLNNNLSCANAVSVDPPFAVNIL